MKMREMIPCRKKNTIYWATERTKSWLKITCKATAGPGVILSWWIYDIGARKWPSRPATKHSRVTLNCMLNAHPNVANATPSGMKNEYAPKTRSPKSTATAFEAYISVGVNTIRYEKFMNTYSAVIIGTEIRIDRGIFLQNNEIYDDFDNLKLIIFSCARNLTFLVF